MSTITILHNETIAITRTGVVISPPVTKGFNPQKLVDSLGTTEKKLEWIEKAAALLFDCQFCTDSPDIIEEISAILRP